jgi:hypothetical protein
VKPDEVRAEQAPQHVLPAGKGAEHFGRGKRDMEEEPDARVREPLAQIARQEHELVVVHPDPVAGTVDLEDLLGEPAVHRGIRLPVLGMQRHEAREVVKDRPDEAVGEAVIVAADLVGAERHRHQPLVGELPG